MSRSKLLVFFALILLMSVPAGLVQAQQVTLFDTVSGSGTAIISDGEPSLNDIAGDTITYSMTDVTPPADGMVYVGWLVSDDGSIKLNTGVLTVESDGSVSGMFMSPDGENFIDTYNKVVITSEEEANADAVEPAGDAVFSHEVPIDAITHIRHLLTSWPPTDNGILMDLKEQIALAITHAELAGDASDIDGVLLHTRHVINIIEGEAGDNFDAASGTPTGGDGIGVLAHAQNRKHAEFAADEASDDEVIAEHAALVKSYGANAEMWAAGARDAALDILDETSMIVAKTLLSTVTGPLDAALNGIDATGDGGAAAAYVEAQMMALYSIEPGAPGATDSGGQPGGPGIGLPGVGDPAIPMLAQMGLIAALVFLGAGGIVLLRGRRTRANS